MARRSKAGPGAALRRFDFSRLALPQPHPASARAKAVPDPRLVHFLDRTTFGYSELELSIAAELGVERWLDVQLDFSSIDDGGLDAMLTEALPTLGMNYQQLFRAGRERNRNDGMGPNPPLELIVATLVRQLYSPRQLYEVMVEFWTNHFNVFLFDGPVQYFKTVDDRDHIRPYALGRFRDLLHANARSPAMLYYLDNYSNTKDGPNENYARELLELHTLGVDGGYTEHTVKEVARCFTGWTLNPRHPDVFVFNPMTHDHGQKFVLETTIPPNRGLEDGRQVLDLLAEHPATARFIAEKLCRRFIADAPPETAVDKVAETFLKTDGDIAAMLRTLFLCEEFADGGEPKFKRPTEFVGSTLRRLDAQLEGDFLGAVVDQLYGLGQLPFLAQPPTGYSDEQSAWLATSSLLERWNFASAVAFAGAGGRLGRRRAPPLRVDLDALAGRPANATQLVDNLVERVLHRDIDTADRAALIDLAETQPGSAAAPQTGAAVLAALLSSPHFQYR